MFVDLYFSGKLSCALDEIEDAFDDEFSEEGEVTGSGAGTEGGNLDIELDQNIELPQLKQRLLSVLERLEISCRVSVRIDGKNHALRDGDGNGQSNTS